MMYKKALSEFHRVLSSKGILHVLVKAQTGDNKTAIVLDTTSKHERFFQYFSQEEIKKLLEEAGFETFKIEQYNERDKDPKGRTEVEWILSLSRKGK